VIRLSGALVVVAIGFLVGGLVTSSLLLVYVAIVVSVIALLLLAVGVVLKRDELFGDEGQSGDKEQSPAGGVRSFGQAAPTGQTMLTGQTAPTGQDASVAQGDFGGSSGMTRWSSPLAPAARTRTDLADSGSPAGSWSPAEAEKADARDPGTDSASGDSASGDGASGDDPHAAAPTADLPVVELGTEAEASEDSATSEGSATGTEGDVAAEAEGGSPSAGKDGDSGQREVVVVPGVPRYHDANCILIRFMGDDDLQKMSLNEATEAECTPCRACVSEFA
jgi:hypothetical protein